VPDAPGLELIAQDLNGAHPGTVLATYHEHGDGCLIVEPAQIREALVWLRDTPGQEYTFLASVHGADYLPAEPRFGVHYELLNMPRVERLRLRAAVADPGPDALPEVPSVADLHPTAEFQEREVYDFFGIVFTGHPDLRRILTDYGFRGFPLRKDFPTTGYVEVRYDEEAKRVVYEPVKLTQEYRMFDFMSPWEGADYILPGDEKKGPA